MRDRDVVLAVKADGTTLLLLHLPNVRADTVTAARSAVDDFLNQLKSPDDRKGTAHSER